MADTSPVYICGRVEIDIALQEFRVAGSPVRGRAFEVLQVLLEAAGRLVAKDELMRRVWPGAVVGDNALEAHVSAIRRALGPDQGLLQTTYGRGYKLLGTWVTRQGGAQAKSAPAGARVPSLRNNLPLIASKLIGRTDAVDQLRDLVSENRIVTLTGLGGIGKTRLALEVAHILAEDCSAGSVWLAELTPMCRPDLVPSTVATAAGLTFGEGEISAASVAKALVDARFLVVLDNCEHVIDAAAELADAIIRACPGARVLATSREPLRIDGEHVYRVPPLDLPPQRPRDLHEASLSGAVRLFVARMQASDMGLAPDRADIASICAICRRLDGIPLAIELAASRTPAFVPKEILLRLEDRFSLLIGGHRTAPSRHQAMRATLDWSYGLLNEAEQRFLRFTAIFPAGFTLDAAVSVLGGPMPLPSVLDCVTKLVTKSLLLVDGSGAPTRWRMLETVRAYALDMLIAQGEAQRAARLHAEHYDRLLAGKEYDLESLPHTEQMSRLARELDNVRTAIDWAFSINGDVGLGIGLTGAYVPVWLHLSLLRECRERAERALDALEAGAALDGRQARRLRLELGLGLFHTAGFTEKAGMALARVLDVPGPEEDTVIELRALWAMWTYQLSVGQQQAAQQSAERFARIAERSGDRADLLVADRLMGNTLHYQGDQRRACRLLQRFVELYAPPDGQRHLSWFQLDQRPLAQATLARVLWLRGRVAQARQHAQASLDSAWAMDDGLAACFALSVATFPIALMTEDLVSAERDLDALRGLGSYGMFWRRWGPCLEATLLIKRGEASAGVRLLEAALSATDRGVRYPEFLGNLAEGLAAVGRLPEALAGVERALAQSSRNGQFWIAAELLRIRGEVIARNPVGRSEAEASFTQAIKLARQQGALFFELRAALGLAQLHVGHGRANEAREVLAPALVRVGDGHDWPDVCSARNLLSLLSPTS